jgi:transcriptional regulator GlxA family with amidase domain
MALRIPREALATVVKGIEAQPVIRIANSHALQLLKGYIGLLREQLPERTPALAHRVGQQLLELTALALNPTRDRAVESAQTVGEARLAAIQADIFANLGEVSLSAKVVAGRQGLSTRHVHRLFEEIGQTFHEFVLEERLKRAYKLLTDPVQRERRISDIAADAGFGDLSTFNRRFRRRFGDKPSTLRHAKALLGR